MTNADEISKRLAAFAWLRDRGLLSGGVYTREELAAGFKYRGERIRFVGPQGIFKPAGFTIPLSITTTSGGPYDDGFSADGLLSYAYRGSNPDHRDNEGLRAAMRTSTPLVYFHSIRPGRYQAAWPVIIIEDDETMLRVKAAIDPAYNAIKPDIGFEAIDPSPLDVRRYITVETRQRLHQGAFRDLVLHAYGCQCAICRLQHPELLDAAHIIPDAEEDGLPLIINGLSPCKIHHAAYDQNILGVSPEYTIRIREDILHEHDGPMLKHGLQELDGSSLILPPSVSDWPEKERLASRFDAFLTA